MIAFCSILVDKFFIIRQAFSITSKLNLLTIGGVVLFVRLLNICHIYHLLSLFTMAPTLVGPWSCGHPFGGSLSHHLTEQTRTNMSQPGRRPCTAVGDERVHILQTGWTNMSQPSQRRWTCPYSVNMVNKHVPARPKAGHRLRRWTGPYSANVVE